MQNELKQRLEENLHHPGEVIRELLLIFSVDKDTRDILVQISAQWKRFQKDKAMGVISYQDGEKRENEITRHIHGIISEITDEQATAYELQNAIFQRILIVCRPDRKEYMQTVFPDYVYKAVTIDTTGKPVADTDEYDLILFDNYGQTAATDKPELLMHYLEQTKCYVLYFGGPLHILRDYPDKAYFANSPFSIHARLNEMIRYIQYRVMAQK